MKIKGLKLDSLEAEISCKNHFTSVAHYGWLYESGSVKQSGNMYCHAGLCNKDLDKKNLVAVWSQMQKPAFDIPEKDREMFIQYMLKESPWSSIFLNETSEEVYKYGWLIDASADQHFVVNAAVATRLISEYSTNRFVFFTKAVKNGMSKDMAMVLSQYFQPSDGSFYLSVSAGHGFVYDLSDKIISNFVNKTPLLKGKPYNVSSHYTRHCDVWDGRVGYDNAKDTTGKVLEKIPVYTVVDKVNLNIFYKDKRGQVYIYHPFSSSKYVEQKVKELLVA